MFAYEKVSNITKPLKVHILVAHLAEFIENYGNNKGLGFYSEQTGKAVHQVFETIFAKSGFKNISSEQYGHNLHINVSNSLFIFGLKFAMTLMHYLS